jgi:hypothetical protein
MELWSRANSSPELQPRAQLIRACLVRGLKPARPAGQAQASYSRAETVQGPLFGSLYQTDQAQHRLCLIPHQGARPKANYLNCHSGILFDPRPGPATMESSIEMNNR